MQLKVQSCLRDESKSCIVYSNLLCIPPDALAGGRGRDVSAAASSASAGPRRLALAAQGGATPPQKEHGIAGDTHACPSMHAPGLDVPRAGGSGSATLQGRARTSQRDDDGAYVVSTQRKRARHRRLTGKVGRHPVEGSKVTVVFPGIALVVAVKQAFRHTRMAS